MLLPGPNIDAKNALSPPYRSSNAPLAMIRARPTRGRRADAGCTRSGLRQIPFCLDPVTAYQYPLPDIEEQLLYDAVL
jgi:hypothetical protein